MRRSPSICIATNHAAPRLACVKPVASVHPEPGSKLFVVDFVSIPFAQNLYLSIVVLTVCQYSYYVSCMKKKDLCEAAGISHASVAKLGKNENVTTDVLVKICTALKCDISDIMEIIEIEREKA